MVQLHTRICSVCEAACGLVVRAEGRQVLSLSAKDLASHGELLKLASLRWLRPHGQRFALEQAMIERWLEAVVAGLAGGAQQLGQ